MRGTSSNGGREDQGPLRREPTPFPKEMRAMAKRMQNLRQTGKEAALAGSMATSHGGSDYRQDASYESVQLKISEKIMILGLLGLGDLFWKLLRKSC